MAMYYLRKEPYEAIQQEVTLPDGTKIPKQTVMTRDVAIYKGNKPNNCFFRQPFGVHVYKMHLYECPQLARVLNVRDGIYKFTGQKFDVYDENGKVSEERIKNCRRRTPKNFDQREADKKYD